MNINKIKRLALVERDKVAAVVTVRDIVDAFREL